MDSETINIFFGTDYEKIVSKMKEHDILCEIVDGKIATTTVRAISKDTDKLAQCGINKDIYDHIINVAKEYTTEGNGIKNKKQAYWLMSHMHDVFYPGSKGSSYAMDVISSGFGFKEPPKKIEFTDKFTKTFNMDIEDSDSDGEIKDADDVVAARSSKDPVSEGGKGADNSGDGSVAVGTKGLASGVKRKSTNESDKSSDWKRSKATETSTHEERVIDMMRIYDMATDYEGFDAKSIRKNFITKCGNREKFVDMLMKSLLIYIKIGNNSSKLNVKRKDIDLSKKLLASVNVLNIQQRATSKDTLTFPRIGLAFMNELFVVRNNFVEEVVEHVADCCDKVYQDVAFAGCPTFKNVAGYMKFYSEFSGTISNGGKGYPDTETGRKERDADGKRWLKTATDGYKKDKQTSDRLTETLSVKSKSNAYKFVNASYGVYNA